MPVFLRQGHIRNILQPIKDTQLAKIAGQQTDYTVLAGVRVTQVALACEAVRTTQTLSGSIGKQKKREHLKLRSLLTYILEDMLQLAVTLVELVTGPHS
jgi:hypothetical protein